MKKAVALKYMPELPAPFILAKGKGDLAERILSLARQHGIEIVEDSHLAGRLIEIDAGDFIPEDLYAVIAEVLVFAMRLSS
jgi:flagellar biosynthesis protein